MSSQNEEYEKARAAVLVVLDDLTKGSIGVISALRRLAGLRRKLAGERLDDDWRVFVLIDSESDPLPIGKVRAYWQAEALAEKDKEIEAIESFYRDQVMISAARLQQRYDNRA